MKPNVIRILVAICSVVLFAFPGISQTTEITYQGQLQSASSPANGTFDFEFVLFDSPGGGTQIGPVNARNSVIVAGGIFSVNLDFGSGFPGATRYLEIRVRQSGGGALTTLSPRQPVTSSPYSIKSLNAANADIATTANNANTANTATNFTGNLAGDVTGTQNATTVARLQNRNVAATAPSNGQVLKYNSSTNQWTPDTDNTGAGGGGTITGVTAGTGLTGGGTTGNVALGIANGGVGTTQLADGAVNGQKIADSSITTTKIAASAVTAPKIASGQVVKSVNTLKDDVTLAAGSNITITPAGNTLTIAATGGASGVAGSGTTNTIPMWSNGTTLGNSLVTQSGTEINMPSVVRFAPSSGFQTNIGTPNSSTGLTFTGPSSRADIRYDGNLTIVNGPGGIQGPANGITIDSTGKVAVGVASCSSTQLCAFNSESGGAAMQGASAGSGSFSFGVLGESVFGTGVYGSTSTQFNPGVGNPTGVTGYSAAALGVGVRGIANLSGGTGVLGEGDGAGVAGYSSNGNAIDGLSTSGTGVYGSTGSTSSSFPAVFGESFGNGGVGVRGEATVGVSTGVLGSASAGTGVTGQSNSGSGVFGSSVSGLAGNFSGRVRIGTFDNGGTLAMCLNASNVIAFCSSSLRYKKDVNDFRGGLSLLNRLHPVTFSWKSNDQADLGLVAESVAAVEPLLTTQNEHGEVEGVKYDRINLVLINAVKEQQAQIEMLKKMNSALSTRLLTVERRLRKSSRSTRRR